MWWLTDRCAGIEPAFEKSYMRRFRVGVRDVVAKVYSPVGKLRVSRIGETGSPDVVELTLVPATALPGAGPSLVGNRVLLDAPRRALAGGVGVGTELEVGVWSEAEG